jgi:hypothetical protein
VADALWVPAVLPLRGGMRWGDAELQEGGGEDEGLSLRTTRLLRKCPELEAFGANWVRAWAPHVREIAEVMRRCPWTAEVVRQTVNNPYMV